MKILEDLAQWKAEYEQGWLAHYRATGEFDWKRYNRPKNSTAPAGPGVDLSQSRPALISSAGAYLRDSQEPFITDHAALGDYTIRLFPSSTPFESVAFAHDFYDHTAVNEDPQVLLPLRHLEDLVREGVIGELAPSIISFCGFQPNVERTLDELIPAIVEAARADAIDAALLVPAWPLCAQSVGLAARALELTGIATTLTTWNAGVTRLTAPPRGTFTRLARGATIGRPHDVAQQRRVLEATLALLAQDAPQEMVRLDESADA